MGDQRLTSCKTAVAQIEAVLKSHPHAWRNYLQSARSVITAVNSISSIGTADWTWIVAVLQDLGFADADDGGVVDISNWCQMQAAYAEGCMTGDLLEKAAEAYMSLGNVSYSRNSQQYFSQALRYLRMTSGISGYQLPEHLQQYLEEYGPLAG
ncbi:uncharacterized protein LTHEOB_12329 [Neofusicoccum parvum]|uniref:Uncharacterized protein LTHEOB_12329 n=1 Tax=Neofusicoccum parvum TaxID=310453 RepID=A0ACB5RXW8_9PEZI|nr:uncharacterized protein LTHEOB_12329 [Neofusicoccum parvum]